MMAILFTQLATAAYACAARPDADSAAAGMAGMPCAEMMSAAAMLDADQPGLCMQHCQFGTTQQAANPLPPLGLAVPALLALYPVTPSVVPSGATAAWTEHWRTRDRAPPSPHSILHCCYRI